MELINLYIKPDLMDSSGVSANSIVNAPATEEGFFAFNSELKKVKIEGRSPHFDNMLYIR